MMDLSFYSGKKVLVTGHTGFKGSWLCEILKILGAEVIGFSLAPPTEPSMFNLLKISDSIHSIIGDVRDLTYLCDVVSNTKPELVFHLAAQPIVRDSYRKPVETYSTNVMGTVNICEAVRLNSCVKSFVNVTTDKVYENKEWAWGYRENDPLDGYDPYSNSKSCSELVTHSYKLSFFQNKVAVSTARAGNVIGGGDFSNDRIIPDCVRATIDKKEIVVRNPYSTRPYQHVMEPLYAYLMIGAKQYENPELQGWYNVGPDDRDCFQTSELVNLFVKYWGNDAKWVKTPTDCGPHEANYLKLDCSMIKNVFGWAPRWNLETAVEKTVEWYKWWNSGKDVYKITCNQIKEFLEICNA